MYINNLNRIFIWLTTSCNFKCDYCHNKNFILRHYESINYEFTVESVKKIIAETNKSTFHIVYTGGEPLLKFELMRNITTELAAYAQPLGKNVVFSLITNGSLINEEVIEHFKDYNYRISLSFDGDYKSYSRHRGCTKQVEEYSKVLDNLNKVKDFPFFHVSMVVTNYTVSNLFESFKFISSLGIRNFGISPDITMIDLIPDPVVYRDQLKLVANYVKQSEEKYIVNPPFENDWRKNISRKKHEHDQLVNVIIKEDKMKVIPVVLFCGYGLNGNEDDKDEVMIKTKEIMDVEEYMRFYFKNKPAK